MNSQMIRPAVSSSADKASLTLPDDKYINEGTINELTRSRPISSFDARVHASIDHICSKLSLAQFIRSRCFELANYLKQEGNNANGGQDISESVANAIACALVSMAHREAWQMHRVSRYLPDRSIGKLYGMSSSAVVYNRHLISSVISKRKVKVQQSASSRLRTLR